METMKSFSLPLLLLVLWYPNRSELSCHTSNIPVFTHEPSDHSIKEGENAMFTCAVSASNPEAVSIAWDVGPHVDSKDVQTRYNVLDQELTSTITVYSVGKTNLLFTCKVKYTAQSSVDASDNEPQICQVTRTASLFVKYFPQQEDLTCKPSNLHLLHEGDILSARCGVLRSKPAVDMIWKLDDLTGASDLPLSVLQDYGLTRTLTNDLLISKDHHMKSLICLVTSEVAFAGQQLQCSIGPIKVLHPPYVTVYPKQVNISYSYPISFMCEATGFPDVATFSWACSPEGIFSGCNATSRNMTIFTLGILSPDISKAIVSCTGYNSEGNDTDVAHVTIHKDDTDNIHSEKSPGWKTDNALFTLNLVQEVDVEFIKMVCLVLSNDTLRNETYFQWYIKDLAVTRDGDSYAVQQEYSNKSSLTIFHHSTIKHEKITCQVRIGNDIKEASLNMSMEAHVYLSSTPQVHEIFTTKADISDFLQTKMSQSSIYKMGDELVTVNNETMGSTVMFGHNLKSNQLSMWQIILIVTIGVIIFVVITVCMVALVYIIIMKYFHHGHQKTIEKEPCDDYALNDPVYEIPNTIYHSYESNLFHSSSSSSSSEVSLTGSRSEISAESDSSPNLLKCDCVNPPGLVVYRNQRVVQMHEMHKKKHISSCLDFTGHPLPNSCLEIPAPPLPTSELDEDNQTIFTARL